MLRDVDVTYVVSPNVADEQAAAAREALHDLARLLGRVSANACHELGLPDMNDPEVAKEIMMATLEALVLSKPSERAKSRPRKPIG